MREIGIGIIGWGFMGRTHTYGAINMPLFYEGLPFRPVLAAVCSGHPENAERAKEEMGFRFATGDYRELLQRPDVEAVSVCTPNHLHEEMTLAALRAGKHVYVDKPLATTYEAAERMADEAEKTSLTAQTALHCPFFPCVRRARELRDEGRIGRVTSFRIVYLHSGSVGKDKPLGWKSDAEKGGAGTLFDLGAHAVHLLEHLAGPIARLLCRTQLLYPERIGRDGRPIHNPGDDAAFLLAELEGGAVGTVEVSKIATGNSDSLRAEVNGEKGAVKFDLMEPNWLWFYDNTRPEAPYGGERGWTQIESVGRFPKPAGSFLPPKNAVGWVRAHADCYYHFLQSVFDQRPAWPSLRDGARVQYVLDAALRSAAAQSWISL